MRTYELIKQIFAQPTAPFFEGFVLKKIETILQKHKIPFFYDTSGNLIAGVPNVKKLKSVRLCYMAHTDHPGFHIAKKLEEKKYEALWYGGAPFNTINNSKVAIYHPLIPDFKAKGKITRFKIQKYTREGLKFEITTSRPLPHFDNYFGAFDFPAYKLKGSRVITRAADDLAGVAIILGMLLKLGNKNKMRIAGLFTRAEEVGFVGCWSLLESKTINKKTRIVSLEASRELPMAEIGKGPILRIGDYSTLFDSETSIELWKSAQMIKQKDKKFNFQRRLMDGGSCEATAANMFGYKTTGIAVPLVNYHNQGKKGPAPEIIDLNDVDGAIKLCIEFARNHLSNKQNLMLQSFKALKKNHTKLKPMLKRSLRT